MRIQASKRGCSLAVLAAATALACASPDVGQPCNILPTDASAPLTECNVQGDFLTSGAIECDSLVCIVSPAPTGTCPPNPKGGVCSKPCVSNNDCFPSETGMECRQVVLDSQFINDLQQKDPALLQKYLGALRFSSYCAYPLSSQ